MSPLAATTWMDKVGTTVISAILLAGLPVALIAIFLQVL